MKKTILILLCCLFVFAGCGGEKANVEGVWADPNIPGCLLTISSGEFTVTDENGAELGRGTYSSKGSDIVFLLDGNEYEAELKDDELIFDDCTYVRLGSLPEESAPVESPRDMPIESPCESLVPSESK